MLVRLNTIDWIALIVTIIGAVNWLLIGLLGFNLVDAIFGRIPVLEDIVYIIFGLGGLWLIYMLARPKAVEAR